VGKVEKRFCKPDSCLRSDIPWLEKRAT